MSCVSEMLHKELGVLRGKVSADVFGNCLFFSSIWIVDCGMCVALYLLLWESRVVEWLLGHLFGHGQAAKQVPLHWFSAYAVISDPKSRRLADRSSMIR